MKKLLILCTTTLFMACGTASKTTITADAAPTTPQDAISTLISGNDRFVKGQPIHPHESHERIVELTDHQSPFVAIVGCSDSRVSQEVVFDQGLGDIFSIRVAGNNVQDSHVMGSVLYAAEHLGVKVIMVLGHSHCGGITAATTIEEHHGDSSALTALIGTLQKDVEPYIGQPEKLGEAIDHHARRQAQRISENPSIKALVDKGSLKVVAAFYDIENGKVTIL